MCLPAGFGEDQAAPLAIDGSVDFGAQVVNNGPAVPNATVVITLPSTLRLDPDFPPTRFEQWWTDNADDTGTPLACVAPVGGPDGRTVTCGTGPLAAGANIIVGIGFTTSSTATPASPPAKFTVALNPALPTTPAPNRVQATVYFVGSAKLILTVNPDHARVVVGKTVTLTGTVHNEGPNAAPNSYLFGADFADDGGRAHFQITNSAPMPGAPSGSGGARTLAIAAGSSDVKRPSYGYWPLDTIAPGKSASTAIVVKASTVGTDELGISASSDAIDQDCDVQDSGSVSGSGSAAGLPAVTAHKSLVKLVPRRIRGHKVTAQQAGVCEDFVLVELTAVAAAPTSSTATTTPPASTVAPTSTTPQPTATDPATSAPTSTAVLVAASSSTAAPASSSAQAAAGATKLASTGAQQTRPMVIASLLAILAGVALCLAGRRRPGWVRGSHR